MPSVSELHISAQRWQKAAEQMAEAGRKLSRSFQLFAYQASRQSARMRYDAAQRLAKRDPHLHVWVQHVQTPTGSVNRVIVKRLGDWA